MWRSQNGIFGICHYHCIFEIYESVNCSFIISNLQNFTRPNPFNNVLQGYIGYRLCFSLLNTLFFIASVQTNMQIGQDQVSALQNDTSSEICIPGNDGVTQVLFIQKNHTGVITTVFFFPRIVISILSDKVDLYYTILNMNHLWFIFQYCPP